MKRGTSRHPKVIKLQRVLKVSRPLAVGMLSLLWEWVGDYAFDGDVTDHRNELAVEAGWDGDPEFFVEAMIDCRLLDEVDGKLLVHDWLEHCERYVKQRLEREQEKKAEIEAKNTVTENGGQRRTTADNSGLPEPRPKPSPLPNQSHAVPPANAGGDGFLRVSGVVGGSALGDAAVVSLNRMAEMQQFLQKIGVQSPAFEQIACRTDIDVRRLEREWQAVSRDGTAANKIGVFLHRLKKNGSQKRSRT